VPVPSRAASRIGYFLSCAAYSPRELIEQAVLAQQAGFEALWISDHFHPWNDEQDEGSFVWPVVGALSQACDLPVTTAVTCPSMRLRPTLVAQAAASAHVMLDGKFTLGVGFGESLDDSRSGGPDTAGLRLEILREAVELIRELWTGETVDHCGEFFTVENARIYSIRRDPPPIQVSGSDEAAIQLAAEIGDGYITTSRDERLLKAFRSAAPDKPTTLGYQVAWTNTADEPGRHVEELLASIEAGFDDVYVANLGPHYAEMIRNYGERVLPEVRRQPGLRSG
jgi:G6PDH family F420-dependent oxidoreductase